MINKYFENPSLGKLEISGVCQEIAYFIKEDPHHFYRLVIGSDSQERRINGNGFKELSLVCAIVIHRLGRGGRYFYQKQKRNKPHSLREKIYTETLFSLEVAAELLPKLNHQLNGEKKYELEIHIDVGRIGETREMIKELVGMVSGNGYKAYTKPDSYGASIVADKHA